MSYASQDAEAALRICGVLRAAEIEVWFDQSELRGGDACSILDEFIAVTGYHHKSAIRALNAEPTVKRRQIRVRPSPGA